MNDIGMLQKFTFSPKVVSGEEVYYEYVESGQNYTLYSYDKSAMFVLPPKPQLNDVIKFTDQGGSTRWFPVKIHRNGNLIMGEQDHMSCDIPNIAFMMKFVGGPIGWQVIPDTSYIRVSKGVGL
jgi:hypothetical protein